MATTIFLGDPPTPIKQWILNNAGIDIPTRETWYAAVLPTAQGSDEIITVLNYDEELSLSEDANIWNSDRIKLDPDGMTTTSLRLKQVGTTWTVYEYSTNEGSLVEVFTTTSESEPESMSFEGREYSYSCVITPNKPAGEPIDPIEPIE